MRKSFVIHNDSLLILDELTDEQAGKLFKAIKNYNFTGEEPDDFILKLAFAPFKNQFIRDDEKYQSVIERNRNNGQKGGRPVEKHKRVTNTGKEIPESTDLHYVYIIKDVFNNEYKIGETSDLVERRNTIKRPSGNLEIVDFILLPKQRAVEVEKNFIEEFIKYRTSGDWFDFGTLDINIPIGYLNSQITQSVNNYPKKADSDSDSDSVNDSDSKNKKEINIPFKDFWILYDKKVGLKKAEGKWNKLTDNERILIMEYIPKYKLSRPDKQYRKDPCTFLNNKSWNDEIIMPETKQVVDQTQILYR